MTTSRRLVVLLVPVLAVAVGLTVYLRTGASAPHAFPGEGASSADNSTRSYGVDAPPGITPLDIIEKALTHEERKVASQGDRSSQERELYLRGFWLNTREAPSFADLEPFVTMIDQAPVVYWKDSDDTSSGPVDLASFSLGVLVKQWHRGAPIDSFAPRLEKIATRLAKSDDEVVRLQASMLLSVMEKSPRGYTLSPAAKTALHDAEQNEWLTTQMAIQHEKVLKPLGP